MSTFSLENCLNGSYGVDTPEEVAFIRRRDANPSAFHGEETVPSNTTEVHSESVSYSSDFEGYSCDSDFTGDNQYSSFDGTDSLLLSYDIDEYIDLSESELRVLFDEMVQPIHFGMVLSPTFSRNRFLSCLSLAKSVVVAPLYDPERTLRPFPELVKNLYSGVHDIYLSDSEEAAISSVTDTIEGYTFSPRDVVDNYEPPPLCSVCGLIAYQCPHYDINSLRKNCAEMTIAHDYPIEGLCGLIDDATLLKNLGSFLLPIQCEYTKLPEPTLITPPELTRPTDRVTVDLLQAICDSTLPTHVCYDDTYHQTFIENADYSVDIDRVRLKQSDLLAKVIDEGHLKPVLNTGSGQKRIGTTREVLCAIKKRNADVPELCGSVNLKRLSDDVAECFMLSFMNGDKLCSSNFINIVSDFHAYMSKWQSVLSYDDLPDLNAENLQFYEHMVKSDVKPSVTDTLNIDRPLPATITFHRKQLTSQFSPLFTALFQRFQRCLTKRVILPVGKISSLEIKDFSVLNKFCLEIDLSKFDKSQGELHLMIQEGILNRLGCPVHISKWWCDFHRMSYIKDKRAGVSMPISFQRRTGDAFTYFGNTLVTMSMFAWCYDTSQFDKLIFSGDDSLGFSIKAPVGDPSLFTSLFNMEAKVMEPSVPYICSKFLLTDDFGNTFSVPDPLREIQRLGSKKIPLDEDDRSLHAHFMSFVDRLKFLNHMNQTSMTQLSLFYEMKYRKSGDDILLVLGAFNKYTANFNAYKELYYSEKQQCALINSFSISDLIVGRGKSSKASRRKAVESNGKHRDPSTRDHSKVGTDESKETSTEETTQTEPQGAGSQKSK
nr:RNA-dependent RNA polymerase [Tomato aspermy virus]